MKKFLFIVFIFLFSVFSVFSLLLIDTTEDYFVLEKEKWDRFYKAYKLNDTDEILNIINSGYLPNVFSTFEGSLSVFDMIMSMNDPRCIDSLYKYVIQYVEFKKDQSLIRSESEQPIQLDISLYIGKKKLDIPVYLSGSKDVIEADKRKETFVEFSCKNSIDFVPDEEDFIFLSSDDGTISLVNYKKKINKVIESSLNKDILRNTVLKVVYHSHGYLFTFETKSIPIKQLKDIKNGNYVYDYSIDFIDKSIV